MPGSHCHFEYKKGLGDNVGGFLSDVHYRMTRRPGRSRKQVSGAGNQVGEQTEAQPSRFGQ